MNFFVVFTTQVPWVLMRDRTQSFFNITFRRTFSSQSSFGSNEKDCAKTRSNFFCCEWKFTNKLKPKKFLGTPDPKKKFTYVSGTNFSGGGQKGGFNFVCSVFYILMRFSITLMLNPKKFCQRCLTWFRRFWSNLACHYLDLFFPTFADRSKFDILMSQAKQSVWAFFDLRCNPKDIEKQSKL